jgi:hypothetical protein
METLEGEALDQAVARCEGLIVDGKFSPSTNWAQGGPIIEREEISVELQREDLWQANKWKGRPNAFWHGSGDKPLVAAMRCYVASKEV